MSGNTILTYVLKYFFIQVNHFQNHLLLPQLTHNITKDCSRNYRENFKRKMGKTWAEHVLPMFCTFSFHAKIKASDKNLPVGHRYKKPPNKAENAFLPYFCTSAITQCIFKTTKNKHH